MGPLYGIEDPIVLETDPVEVQISLRSAGFLPELVLAKVREGPLADLVLLQKGKRFHVVPALFPLRRADAKVSSRHLLGLRKGSAGNRYLLCIEIPLHGISPTQAGLIYAPTAICQARL